MSDNLVFHLLDIQTRDGYVTSESKTSKEVIYESDGDIEGDAEFRPWNRRIRGKTTKFAGKGRREYTVHLFGNTASGQTVRVDVTGFRPYFYIKLPSEGSYSDAKREIQNYIEGQLSNKHNVGDEFTYKVVNRRDFIGFTGRQDFMFLRISMPSISAFRDCRGLFLDKDNRSETRNRLGGPWEGITPAVYEANIDPMLRFIHDTGIKPCDWVSVKDAGDFLDDAEKGELLVLDADVSSIGPANSGPNGVPTAPFLKAFWDIECYSETGDFPVAKRTWSKAAKDILLAVRDGKITRPEQIHEEISKAVDGKSAAIGHILCEPITSKGSVALSKAGENSLILEEIYNIGRGSALDIEKAKHSISDKLNKLYSTTNKALVLRGDPVIQIGTILTRGSSETTERHLFTFNTCGEIPGAVVHAFKDEAEMIEEWFKWLVKANPDELVGYNIFGFDERYLWERCEVNGLTDDDCAVHELSRLSDQGNKVKLSENRLSSSALGDNFLYTWTTAGRLQVDLYFYVKRSGASLTSYKLDDVAKHYMSGKVKAIQVHAESQEIILNCGGAVGDVRPGRFLQLMDDIGESVCDKISVLRVDLKDNKSGTIVCSATDLTEDEHETIGHGTKWAIVKDDVSPQDIFRLWRGTAKDRARIGGYCVQDCELVMELYKKLEVFNNSMSMANVCLVPISFIFMRGQGVKIESLIFRECAAAGTLIPVLENPPQNIEGVPEESYEGAIVLDPEPGLYKDSPVGVCDFASLYPSTIISENISHDMLVWVRDYTDGGDLIENVWGSDEYSECEGYAYTDIEFDLLKPDPADRRKNPEKIRCGRRICRYAEPLDGTKGLLPEIIKKLLAARKAKRKEAEREENPERKNLLDAEQLAYKITANSLYGQLGSKTFKVRLVYLAASVTAYARKQLLFSKDCIEVFYGPGAGLKNCSAAIKYGDTDSVFVEVNPRNPETGERLHGRDARQAAIDLTEEMGHFITQALRAPHDFEFDKIFDPLLMFSKKRYAGKMYESNADDFVYKYMGIALKRRDNAPIVKTVFGGAMRELLDRNDVAGAAELVKKVCDDLVEGRMSMGQLTITKSLRAEYANANGVAHKVLAERMAARDPGNAPAAGDRIPYIYIQPAPGQVASKLQGDRIETPAWVRLHDLKPDYSFYLTNQIQNPVCEMFAIVIRDLPGYSAEHELLLSRIDNTEMRLVRAAEIASEILLGPALAKCVAAARMAFATKFFGAQSNSVASRTRLATQKRAAESGPTGAESMLKSASVQSSIHSFFSKGGKESKELESKNIISMDPYLYDSMIVEKINKQRAEKKKAAAAAAATTASGAAAQGKVVIKRKIK